MLKKATALYIDGFRNLTLGRVLWKIVLLKLFVIFVVLKFGIYGSSLADMGSAQSSFVLDNLTQAPISRPIAQSTLQASDSQALWHALDSQATLQAAQAAPQAASQNTHATPHAQQSAQPQESTQDSPPHTISR